MLQMSLPNLSFAQAADLTELAASMLRSNGWTQPATWQTSTNLLGSYLPSYNLVYEPSVGTIYSQYTSARGASSSLRVSMAARAAMYTNTTSPSEITVVFGEIKEFYAPAYSRSEMDTLFAGYASFNRALLQYVVRNGISRVNVVGVGVGGEMAERFMSSSYATGGATYVGLSLGSPTANRYADSRILTFGHADDPFYRFSSSSNSAWSNVYKASTRRNPESDEGWDYAGTMRRLNDSALSSSLTRSDHIVIQVIEADSVRATALLGQGTSGQRRILLGHVGADTLIGSDGDDIIEGFTSNDEIDGGAGTDTAVFSGNYADYTISKLSNNAIQVSHTNPTGTRTYYTPINDGTDTLFNIEYLQFADRTVATSLQTPPPTDPTEPSTGDGGAADGPKYTRTATIKDSSGNKLGMVGLELPSYMLDGTAEFKIKFTTADIARKNHFYFVIDCSGSMAGGPLDVAKQAFITLINDLLEKGVGYNPTFSIIPFGTSAANSGQLGALDAIRYIESLPYLGLTNYETALQSALTDLRLDFDNANAVYFLSDGRPNMGSFTDEAALINSIADVRAYGVGNADLYTLRQVDDGAQQLRSITDLSAHLLTSDYDMSTVARVQLIVDGVVVRDLTPANFTNNSTGFVFEGELEGLATDKSARAEISLDVTFTNGSVLTQNITTELAVGSANMAPTRWTGADFNNDGIADVALMDTTGYVLTWTMDGARVVEQNRIRQVNASWTLITTGDFDGDGVGDLMFRNTDGSFAAWSLDGPYIENAGVIGGLTDPEWTLATTADLDGDLRTDMIFQRTTGEIALWRLDGPALAESLNIQKLSDPGWKVRGAADMDGDGRSDLLLQHADGRIARWNMNSATIESGAVIKALNDPSWSVVGMADLEGDARADIILRHDDGRVAAWLVDQNDVASGHLLTVMNDPSFAIEAMTDFDADGRTDILLRNSNGVVAGWTMRDGLIANGALITTIDTGTTIAGNSGMYLGA